MKSQFILGAAKTILRTGVGLTIAAAAACSADTDSAEPPEGSTLITAEGEGELTLTKVTLSPDASPIIEYRRISRAAADRMDALRREGGAIVGTAKAGTGEGEHVGETQEALEASVSTCPGEATWLYDDANHTGNRLCIMGRGKLDLANVCRTWATRLNPFTHEYYTFCTSYWWDSTGVVKSVWPGVEDGSLLAPAPSGEPVGRCADQCTSWGSWGSFTNLNGPILGLGGQCLDVQWGSSANGTPVWMWPCNGGVAQVWRRTAADEIRIAGLGDRCLDARDPSAVRIYDCDGRASQRWTFLSDGSIRPSSSIATCLDVTGGGTYAGTPVGAATCNSALPSWAPQVWDFAPCASTSRWVEHHVWGTGCWLDSSAYTALGDAPQNQEYDWTADPFQGVATTPTEWYTLAGGSDMDFTIYDTSKSRQLGSSTDSQHTYPAGGWHHAGGDLDWYQGPNVPHGYLFVPMEAPPDYAPWLPNQVAVAVVDPITRVWSINALDTEGHGPWVAINPRDQMLYTSLAGDREAPRVFELRAYTISVPTDPFSATVAFAKKITLKDENGVPLDGNTGLQRVSGGAFSKNGHLYLASWDHDDRSKTGIYGFDVETGRRRVFMHVESGSDDCQELEGLTVDSNTPYAGGDIHLAMWGLLWGDSYCGVQYQNIWFKHFHISDTSKL